MQRVQAKRGEQRGRRKYQGASKDGRAKEASKGGERGKRAKGASEGSEQIAMRQTSQATVDLLQI